MSHPLRDIGPMRRRRESGWKPPGPQEYTWYLWEEPRPRQGESGRVVMLEDGAIEMVHRIDDVSLIIPGRTLWRPIPGGHSAP